ncbi:MAG: 2'-5' RNA ligase family protein [Acidobacteria bacterium]|nr:2'-5' RNA ligase family protein [Acidobacteriota bacterium]
MALLLPESVNARAQQINAALWAQRNEGFRFDRSHRPHITLVQQFVQKANLAALLAHIDPVLSSAAALRLRAAGVAASGLAVGFLLESTLELQRLHETLMDTVEPWEARQGAVEAFYADGETARPEDVEWVSQYRARGSYANFTPHITLGIGTAPELGDPFEFVADRVGLFQLGRFCTCRVRLKEWKIPPIS